MERRSFLFGTSFFTAAGKPVTEKHSWSTVPEAPTTEFWAWPSLFCPYCLNELFRHAQQILSDDGNTLLGRVFVYEHCSPPENYPYPRCVNSGKKYQAALPKVQLREMKIANG